MQNDNATTELMTEAYELIAQYNCWLVRHGKQVSERAAKAWLLKYEEIHRAKR